MNIRAIRRIGLLLLLTVASLGVLRAATDTPSVSETTSAPVAAARFEYKVLALENPYSGALARKLRPEKLTSLLNEQARDGWRLVGVGQDDVASPKSFGIFERAL